MRIRNFFRRKPFSSREQASGHCTPSRDDELRRLQLLLQSPYGQDRELAVKNLRDLADGKIQTHSHQRLYAPTVERIVLVLDRSGSMDSQDYPPSRLGAAVDAAREMIRIRAERDPRDEVGIVWFNKMAYVLVDPICLSKGKGRLTNALGILTPEDGTDINAGLSRARDLLRTKRWDIQDRIVLLTDGHGGQPLDTAKALKANGVVIDVIGIGGSPAAVNEELLCKVASSINGDLRYRFIWNRAELFQHFRQLADKLVK
jgi:Mg-chelatase subunit ChlD